MKMLASLSLILSFNLFASEYVGNNLGAACNATIELSKKFVKVDEYSVKSMTATRIDQTVRMIGMNGQKSVLVTLELNSANEFISAKYESVGPKRKYVTDASCTDLVKVK